MWRVAIESPAHRDAQAVSYGKPTVVGLGGGTVVGAVARRNAEAVSSNLPRRVFEVARCHRQSQRGGLQSLVVEFPGVEVRA